MYYCLIKENKIISIGECPCSSDGCVCVEITEEQYETLKAYGFNYYLYKDEEFVINPNYEEEQKQKERERLNLCALTKREVFLALYKDKGIAPDQIRSQITDVEALIEFDYANEYYRGNPLIDKIGLMLGYSTEELDYLFEHKAFPEEKE